MANQFLIKETMDAMRSLSADEIDALQVGTYAGVQLLGYHEKGDTPAPIIYYLAPVSPDPGPDDGGAVIHVGQVKLEHNFEDKIHVSYFGIKGNDESEDCTDIYNKVINRSKNNGTIEWYGGKVYRGEFSSTKALTLEGNGATLQNSTPTSYIVRFFSNTLVGYTTVVGIVGYGDVIIPLLNVAGIEPGDIITIYDTKGRPQDGMLVNYETLIVKEVYPSNNTIEIHDMVRSTQNQDTVTVNLIKNPLRGVKVRNMNVNSDESHLGGTSTQISFWGCKDSAVENIQTYNNLAPAIQFRNCVEFSIKNITHYKPKDLGGGFGYGTACNFSRDGYLNNITGYKMRHTVDLSYSIEINGIKDYRSYLPIALAHNTFGGNLSVTNILVDGISDGSVTREVDAALHIQGQGMRNPNAHVFRDLFIDNVTLISSRLGSSPINGVLIQCSVNNVHIANVKVINKREGYDKTAKNDAVVYMGSCSINGSVRLKNLYSNLLGCAFLQSLGAEVSVNEGLLEIDGVRLESSDTGFVLLGTKKIKLSNCNLIGAIPNNGYIINNVSGQYLIEAHISEDVQFSPNIRLFNADNYVLLYGKSYSSGVNNYTNIIMVSNITLRRNSLDCRSVLRLVHNFSSDLNITSDSFIDDPQFWGERKILLLNNPEDFGVKGDVIIPNTNRNIINPDGGYGLTLKSGEAVTLIGVSFGPNKVWLVERMNHKQ